MSRVILLKLSDVAYWQFFQCARNRRENLSKPAGWFGGGVGGSRVVRAGPAPPIQLFIFGWKWRETSSF